MGKRQRISKWCRKKDTNEMLTIGFCRQGALHTAQVISAEQHWEQKEWPFEQIIRGLLSGWVAVRYGSKQISQVKSESP